MGDLSQHFSRREFKCKCQKCGHSAVDHELITVLERLRVHCEIERKDSFITITSGNRCYKWNLDCGGAPKSKHLFSIAADIQVKGWSPTEIYDILDAWYPDTFGIKEYSNWVHFDVRSYKWRGKRP